MRILVFEDAGVSRLGPLAQTRPAFGLRCGAVTLLERQTRCLAANEVGLLVRPEMAALSRFLWPGLPVNDRDWLKTDKVLLVNGRWLAPDSLPLWDDQPSVGLVNGEVAFALVPADEAAPLTIDDLGWHLSAWKDRLPAYAAGGALIDRPWDLVEHNARALEDDGRFWRTHRETAVPQGTTIVGPADRFLADPSAKVEPLALIDTTNGPVILDRGVIVQAFSRLEGPCYVGPETHVLAGRLKGVSVGPQCRVGGEVESSIIYGHSNKAHEGFLGHSYLGEWVNFGAGTQTSDLRNDYGNVPVTIAGKRVDTGLLKVGSFVGDHTKTSINTMFNTGSVCGPFAMLVTAGKLMPRNLPAYCQVVNEQVTARTDLGQMFRTARTMMARRGVAWTEAHEDFYLDLYERTADERRQALGDTEQRRMRRVV
jgi:UDP-N-acetylglucosamine diphosphorylase/glucosamine-1-phosphate N-acetyltransferase